ncbi:hypothetical protein F444_10665 [Phytophthora nicotianae P1976]|uniref:RxLR effector protein n=1 Tax=Phytophthora nicotianae P1976 TaxID=1317066 RepID=A0A081A3C3_PHYNI|nr:hypothetical protein F444_10665 [Phytophthora nicotianae P1976]
MRLTYLLLLAVCVVIALCDTVFSFVSKQEVTAAQHAAGGYRDASGKRLLRSDNAVTIVDDVADEDRLFSGVSKLTEALKKGKTKLIDKQVLLQTKLKDKQLLRNYQQLLKGGFSDEAITGAWLTRGKSLDNIFDRWIRLEKSERQAANNLLKQKKTPEDLYSVFAQRGMKPEQIQTLWRSLKLDESELIAFQKKFVLIN